MIHKMLKAFIPVFAISFEMFVPNFVPVLFLESGDKLGGDSKDREH